MHAEKCPICEGKGSIHEYGFRGKSTACDGKEHVCHGCDGKAWVEVPDTERIVVSGSSIQYEPLFPFTPTVLIKTDAWYQMV